MRSTGHACCRLDFVFVPRCQSQRRKGPGSSLYDGGWSAGPTTRRGETVERVRSTEFIPWSGSYIWVFRGEEESQRKISSTERRCRKVEGKNKIQGKLPLSLWARIRLRKCYPFCLLFSLSLS